MRGFITEKNWPEVDRLFPRAHRLYLLLPRKPRTFLELLNLCHSFDPSTLRLRRIDQGKPRGGNS